MRNCTICKKPIELKPTAAERAKKYGNTPQYYTNLFTEHPQCTIEKSRARVSELIRSNNEALDSRR